MSTYDELTRLDSTSLLSNLPRKDNQSTSVPTQKTTPARNKPRNVSSGRPRSKLRRYPTREEIQEFSFRLRDQLKVKVQAEVPHRWQKELEEVARELNVRKLELYRYMIGEFLEKVKRKNVSK
jgi:hypothetical protein